jgi:hypothetical protein
MRVPRCREMMEPPVTNSPAKAFTPSRCAFESRPFVELPPPFLCAIAESPFQKQLAAFNRQLSDSSFQESTARAPRNEKTES